MQMTGGHAIMEIFKTEGVEYIFGIPGATEVYFMEALQDHPEIKYILGLHEVVSAGMAEGYARTSGKPGVLNLHTITGLGAALPMLHNAYQGGVPLIITAGQQDTRLLAYDPALAGDLVKIVSPFTKWATEINYAEDIPTVLRRAFQFATRPPTGPVFISLPQNIMADKLDFSYIKSSPSFTRIRPDSEAIKVALRLILKAQNPVIIVEDGVAKSQALDEVVKLAELIGARVYQPWMSDVNFPLNHALYAGDLDEGSLRTPEILSGSDVLISIGTTLFSQIVYLEKPLLPLNVPLIQIDDNPWQIGKNYPAACGFQGDIKVSINELISALQNNITDDYHKASRARIKAIGTEKQQSDQAFTESALKDKDSLPIASTRLMQEIKDNLLPGTRIVDDCWSCSAVLRRTLGFSTPLSYQRSRNGGSIGWGLPGSLGAKLASPDNPVVCIAGDGSAMWSIQSLWTAARYQIPVTFIICANGRYQQVRLMKSKLMGERARGRYLGTDLSQPQNDFCQIAAGMGIPAQRVETPGQLKPALQKAFHLNQPNLVEVRIG